MAVDIFGNPVNQNFVVPQQAPASGQKKPSFLQSLFPSIGGLVGGVGGGAAGGALAGSAILPGVGTAVGGLLGALLGGGAGGAVGKVAENKALGDSAGHDVLKEGLIQGALSAGPLRLLKGASAGGKALLAGGEALGADAAGQAAAQGGGRLVNALTAAGDAATAPSVIKTAIADKLGGAGDNLAQKALKLNASKFNTDFANRTGEEVGQFSNRFKLVGTPLAEARDKLIAPASDIYGKAIGAIGDIPKADVLANVQSDAAKLLGSKLPEKQALGQALVDKANTVLKDFGDTIPAQDLNSLKSEIYNTIDKKVTDSAGKYANNINDNLANSFRKTINGAADTAGVTPDMSVLSKLGYKSGSVADLGHEINNLDQLLNHADIKSRVGGGAKLFGLGNATGATAGGVVGGVPGAAIGAAGNMALNSGVGQRALAGGVEGVANLAEKAAARSAAPYGAMNVAKRVLPAGLLGTLQSQSSNASSMAANTSANTTANPANMPGSSANNSQMSIPGQSPTDPNQVDVVNSQSPFDPANVQQNAQAIIAHGGKLSDVAQYVSLVSALQGVQKNTDTTSKLSTAQQARHDALQSALSSLDGANQNLVTAGGAKGVLGYGATIPGVGQYIDAPGAAYTNTKIELATQLAKAVTGGSRPGQDIIDKYLHSLPNVTDRPQYAAAKLQKLRAELESQAHSFGYTDLLNAGIAQQ